MAEKKEGKKIPCTNRGMARDYAISKVNGQDISFAWENRNIRISTTKDDNTLVITNEKGTTGYVAGVDKKYIGHCIIKNYLVVFTTKYIFLLTKNSSNSLLNKKILFESDTELDYNSIETFGYYESDKVIKVYWIDGVNPNRFINIMDEKYNTTQHGSWDQFNFQGQINKIPQVTIEKDYNLSGSFNSGTIQYFITYYNKFGNETCLCYNSDIQYLSVPDRGAKVDEKVICGFRLNITNIDNTYDYLRVYSYQRNSLNGEGVANIVSEVKTSDIKDNTVEVIDLGINNTLFSAKDLPYVGGQDIRASTFDQKQDTLFLGDINIESTEFPDALKKTIDGYKSQLEIELEKDKNIKIQNTTLLDWSSKEVQNNLQANANDLYFYNCQLNKSQSEIAGFKRGEIYRFAIQFMTKQGEWLEPYWIGDKYCNETPGRVHTKNPLKDYLTIPTIVGTSNLSELLTQVTNYISYRILMSETTPETRRIVAQGVINPTMFNYYDRYYNKPYSINSWMFRPRLSNLVNRHYDEVPVQTSYFAEIQGITKKKIPGIKKNLDNNVNSYCLFLNLDGDWISECRIAYHLYLFHNDGQITPVAENTLFGEVVDKDDDKVRTSAAPQNAHNTLTYRISCGHGRKVGWGPETTRAWLYEDIVDQLKNLDSEINPYGVFISDSMLPTAKELKQMALARDSDVSTDTIKLIFAAIGTAILTAASIVLSCVTFGAAAAPLTAVNVITIGAVAAMAGAAAVVGGSATASIAEKMKDAPDVVQTAAKYGFYPLVQDFQFTKDHREQYNTDYENFMKNTFSNGGKDKEGKYYTFTPQGSTEDASFIDTNWNGHDDDKGHGLDDLNFNKESTVYVKIGRLDFTEDSKKQLLNKQDGFYVDESVVTLNTPELEDVSDIINNSDALKLQLVGVIPISTAYAQNQIYASNGMSSQSKVINETISNIYPQNIDGLTCGNWYQDTDFQPIPKDSTDKIISDGGTVQQIKNFMWNRDSLSIYNSKFLYKDPVQLSTDDTTNYLTYIPGKINKKVVANLKYSDYTQYYPEHSIEIESPVVFNEFTPGILKFSVGGKDRLFENNVNAVSLNTEGYKLLKDKGNDIIFKEEDTSANLIKDPVSIKYNSTPNILIPLAWEANQEENSIGVQQILPYIQGEEQVDVNSLYDLKDETVGDYIIDGLDVSQIEKQNYTINYVVYRNISDSTIIATLNSITDKNFNREKQDEIKVFIDNLVYPFQNDYIQQVNDEIKLDEEILNAEKSKQAKSVSNAISKDDVVSNAISNYLFNDSIKANLNVKLTKDYNFVIYFVVNNNNDNIYYKLILHYKYSKDTIVATDFIKIENESDVPEEKQDCPTLQSYKKLDWLPRFAKDSDSDDELHTTYYYSVIDPENETENAIKSLNKINEQLTANAFSDLLLETYEKLFVTTWAQNKLSYVTTDEENKKVTKYWNTDGQPYLFIGELVKKDYNWTEIPNDYELKQINWNVCSFVTPINAGVDTLKTWGDTYYQRWDCLKTYPTSEEEINSNVDILSFMVETHKNIDGRCDVNRGISNILNDRPTNFNIMNSAYDQQDNYFQYKILDQDKNLNQYPTQIVWSLTKTPMEDVDSWTSINAVNFLNLNGSFGKVNKIINKNDTLLTFQDKGISTINFNEKTAIASTTGLPIQLGNTNKVTGYTVVSDKIGCINKWSINLNSSGLYFMDDNTKDFYCFNNERMKNVGVDALFSSWFKQNMNGKVWTPSGQQGFKTQYDENTNDLYILNEFTCLVYNSKLQTFTSFMDYKSIQALFNLEDESFILYRIPNYNYNYIYKLFSGSLYGNYPNGIWPYSITYRVNPDEYHNHSFTNFEYVADIINDNKLLSNDTKIISPLNNKPDFAFDTVTAWNEYQKGELNIKDTNRRAHLKPKYRTWSGDIPRDGDTTTSHNYHANRMNNPWIFFKLSKNNDVTKRMIFHNLTLTYY